LPSWATNLNAAWALLPSGYEWDIAGDMEEVEATLFKAGVDGAIERAANPARALTLAWCMWKRAQKGKGGE
jgi:hypothetical protein